MHFFGHRGNRYRRIVRQARHLQCASRLFGQSRLWRSGRRSGSTQIHLLCGQRRRLHTCRHHRSDIRDASGMAYRRKRALFAMPCGCDRRLQSATRRDLVIEACVRIISSCGDQSLGETPGPIPNPEAKPWHGDGTMPERTWESSTPPQPHFTEGPGNTRSPGLPRIPGTTQNPRHGHRRTGEHITPRDLHPMNTPPNRKNNNSLLFSPHLHASKPEEQPQSNTIFPIASSHCHLLTLSSWNAMLNNPSLCAACHRI